METAFAGISGALIGSFLNVVVYRLPLGQSLVKPRSRCTKCDTPVAPRDNVPVLSWLLLRGRCRHCGHRISARYPAVELLAAAVFAAVVVVRGADARLALELPFAAMLVAVADIDLEHRIVPNKILLPLAVWGLAGGAVLRPHDLPELLGAGGGAFAFFLLAALVHPAGMGMGDVKLAGVMGLFLGASVIPALLLAFLAGSVVGLAMLARHGAAARKHGVPFGPVIAIRGGG